MRLGKDFVSVQSFFLTYVVLKRQQPTVEPYGLMHNEIESEGGGRGSELQIYYKKKLRKHNIFMFLSNYTRIYL